MERRRFLVKAAGVAAGGAVSVKAAPFVHAQQRFSWRMATSYTPSLDIALGTAHRFADIVQRMSDKRLQVKVFAAGELMPALAVFDGVSQGTVEAYFSYPSFWAGKEPALQWFASVPFGLNSQGHHAWLYHGGGQKLWEEACAPYNLVPRLGASCGAQMAGWFKKKISSVADVNGLKFRMPGLAGKVMAAAGAAIVLLPPGEIYTALERGVIDGADWIGPHDDIKLGLPNTARYYHFPGWHEPTGMFEMTFNRKAYDALPADLRAIVDHAAGYCYVTALSQYEAKNNEGLIELQTKYKGKVEIAELPREVIEEFRKRTADVMRDEAARSPMAKKVAESYEKFRQSYVGNWVTVSEAAYYRLARP